MKKACILAAAAFVLIAASPASAQFPMDGTPGGPQKMDRAKVNEVKKQDIKANLEEGLMDRAIHRMKVSEKKALNEALVERGSLVLADGSVIEKNKDAGEQVIDPRTPKGFGNPFFRAIHVEQNIKVNNLLSEFEQKELARLKWQEDDDVKANATEEIQIGTGWTPVIAKGDLQTPAVRGAEFMAMMETSKNKIIRRVCESCDDTHKDIYYKRLNDNYMRSLFTMLKDNKFDYGLYKDTANECWTDFTLHSTYEDAVAGTNPWEHCHPDSGRFKNTGRDIGFPSYSGPEKHDGNNMNEKQSDYAFYVETSEWIPCSGTWRLDIPGKRDGVDIEQAQISKISQYLDESPHRIARWICNDCVGVYKDVYFKHNAPVGMSVAGVEYFLLENFQPIGVEGFEFRQDFNIFSTYEDAIADRNAWEHCDWLPANTYGFPAGCRPKTSDAAIPNQWARVSVAGGTIKNDFRAGIGAQHTCLYVEKPDEESVPDREQWMSDDEEMELFFYGSADELPQCLAEGSAAPNQLGGAYGTMDYHGTATVDQKYHSPQWYGNPADTYQGARDFCKSKGMDLCPMDKVCPGGTPDGGTRSGDQWAPVLDEDNLWVQIGTWINGDPATTCTQHEPKPDWGLYGQEAWGGTMNFNDLVQCCGVAEEYAYDDYAGWYDVHGCGECHDFCFWLGVPGTAYDPIFEAGSNPLHTPIAYGTDSGTSGESEYVLLPGGQYSKCPDGREVPQTECLAAANSLTADLGTAITNRETLLVSDWVGLPCGCFVYQNNLIDFDTNCANSATEEGTDLVCKQEQTASSGALKGYFTCVMSGSGSGERSTDLTFLEDDRGIKTFQHRKCAGKGIAAPRYRAEEYMGCYRTGYPQALPELIGSGQPLTFSKCADACSARNYHYFGRTGNGQCRCGGRTLDDHTFERYGLIPYGSSDFCRCDDDFIGNGGMCTYRVVDQFDPNTARKHHPCRYLPAQDMRKMCYIACRDSEQSFTNKLTCKMLETMGMTYLSKMINKHNDDGGQQLHMLGGDVGDSSAGDGTRLGTF